MDDVALVRNENLNLRKIQQKLLQWEKKECSLSHLTQNQIDAIDLLNELQLGKSTESNTGEVRSYWLCSFCLLVFSTIANSFLFQANGDNELTEDPSNDQQIIPKNVVVDSSQDFLNWFNSANERIINQSDDVYRHYYDQLQSRRDECDLLLGKINSALDSLNNLNSEYSFVSNKTCYLNMASEKLIEEQNKLIATGNDIKERLHYFTQAENLLQILQSPTISVASEIFAQTLGRVDECIAYIKENVCHFYFFFYMEKYTDFSLCFQNKFKDSPTYLGKYNMCLAKAIVLIKNYLNSIFTRIANQITEMKDSAKSGGFDTLNFWLELLN